MQLIRTIEYPSDCGYVEQILDVAYDELKPGDSLFYRSSEYHAEEIRGTRPSAIWLSRSGWVNRAYIQWEPDSLIRIYRRVYR